MNYIASLVRRLRPDRIIYVFGCLVVLVSAFGPLVYLSLHAPAGTQYRFADGFFSDYYHYLMKIKSGMMGHVGYYNRYTEIPQPVSYGHALFAIMGYVSGGVGLYRADIVYLISRVATLLFLFTVVYRVTTKFFHLALYRIAVFFLFFTGTSGYTIVHATTGLRAVEPITFSGFYNALQKFPAPPHHLLASTLLLLIAGVVLGGQRGVRKYIYIAVSAFVIGMLQPFIGIVGVLSFGFVFCFYFIFDRQKALKAFIQISVFVLASALPILYYAYLFGHVLPWTIWAQTTFGYNYQTDFLGYIVANIVYVPFVLLLIPVMKKLPPFFLFLLGWGAVIPTALYPFAARGTLLSLPRLLQVQQYIPLSLLSGYGIWQALHRYGHRTQRFVTGILVILMVGFAALPWQTTIADSFTWKQPGYYNVFIPNDFIDAMNYLELHTQSESVVLTGEYMSAVIPAFTHNRVILGRGDVVSDYGAKLRGMYAVFGPNPEPIFIKKYLDTYRISYVIFGTDTPSFDPLYSKFPFFQPIFSKGNVTVAKVLR